jgi:hemerythrin-like domain-containing protein
MASFKTSEPNTVREADAVPGGDVTAYRAIDLDGDNVQTQVAAGSRDIAQYFARIHSVITYALETSIERGKQYAEAGYPDKRTRKGFVSYVRCLSALLHAHHTTEDDLAFPYFWEKMPELPVERLIAQHQQMDPLLDRIRADLSQLAKGEEVGPSLTGLGQALREMLTLWQGHVKAEEQHLTTERIDAVIDREEQDRIRRRLVLYSRRLQRRAAPLSLLIPFTLYNLSCEERMDLAPKMAQIVTRWLIPHIWRRRWMPMASFLRDPPQL